MTKKDLERALNTLRNLVEDALDEDIDEVNLLLEHLELNLNEVYKEYKDGNYDDIIDGDDDGINEITEYEGDYYGEEDE